MLTKGNLTHVLRPIPDGLLEKKASGFEFLKDQFTCREFDPKFSTSLRNRMPEGDDIIDEILSSLNEKKVTLTEI